MNINTISTKELRENFGQVLAAVARGEELTLLYRSKPLAQIKPLKSAKAVVGRSFSKKQIQSWIKSDRLTVKEQRRIDVLIKRFS